MGGAMARSLKRADFDVIGFDIDEVAVASARAAGVRIAATVAAVAERTDNIILSLPSAKAAIATAQILAGIDSRSCTIVETSTLALVDKMAIHSCLSDAGHTVLDCPLSGTGAQAVTKDLVIFASGDASAIQRLEPVFLGFGRQVKFLGAYGNGSKMKFVANLLVAIHNVATGEAMVLGMKAGLDPHQIVDVVASGAGNSRVFELRAPMMARNDYMPPTMRARNWKKDMAVIGAFASELECPTPLFNATSALYDAALAMGREAQDVAGVCAVFEIMAGLKRTV
ncbi:MAG: NAD(P)-dependent oxidoreductase [Hyphomicrobiaceae bacterium]|nr:NAD(P)-dependent oxidoreductase [Hyphomicrobiaceae bacterium]